MGQLTNPFRCWQSFSFSEPQDQLQGSKNLHFIAEMIYSQCFHCMVRVPLFFIKVHKELQLRGLGTKHAKRWKAKSQMQIQKKKTNKNNQRSLDFSPYSFRFNAKCVFKDTSKYHQFRFLFCFCFFAFIGRAVLPSDVLNNKPNSVTYTQKTSNRSILLY